MRLLVIILILAIHSSLFAAGPRSDVPEGDLYITALSPLCESMGQHDAVKCKNLPQVKKYRCDDIKPPPQHWGGLNPHPPMGICQRYLGSASGPMVRLSGCKAPIREQLLVLVPDGKKEGLEIIEDADQFRKFFTPIDSAKEVISFVSALTGAYPKYEFSEKFFIKDMNENGKYTTGKPKPTEVWEKKDGWHVRLFDNAKCGCYRPELFEIEYVVTRNGYIKELKKNTIWEANRNYQICID